jgi:hypothetical protein
LETFLHAQNSASCGSYLFLLVLDGKDYSLLVEVCKHLIGFYIIHHRNVIICPPEGSSGVGEAVDSFGLVRGFSSVSNGVDSRLNVFEGDWLYFASQGLRSSFGFLYHHLFIIIDYEGRELPTLRFRVTHRSIQKTVYRNSQQKRKP